MLLHFAAAERTSAEAAAKVLRVCAARMHHWPSRSRWYRLALLLRSRSQMLDGRWLNGTYCFALRFFQIAEFVSFIANATVECTRNLGTFEPSLGEIESFRVMSEDHV